MAHAEVKLITFMINLKHLKDTFKILKALLDTQVWKCICLLLVMYIFVPYYGLCTYTLWHYIEFI